jgi:hypothetical protein
MGGGLSRLMRMCGRSIGLGYGGWGSVESGGWFVNEAQASRVMISLDSAAVGAGIESRFVVCRRSVLANV